MTKEKAEKISYAIEKECCKFDLTDWCEEWEFTTDEFDEFLEAAIKYIDLSE